MNNNKLHCTKVQTHYRYIKDLKVDIYLKTPKMYSVRLNK